VTIGCARFVGLRNGFCLSRIHNALIVIEEKRRNMPKKDRKTMK